MTGEEGEEEGDGLARKGRERREVLGVLRQMLLTIRSCRERKENEAKQRQHLRG